MDRTKVIMVSLFAILVLATVVKADIAPPPIAINVTYNGSPINGTFYATALICTNSSSPGMSGLPIPQLNISYYDAANQCYWTNDNFAMSATCGNSWCHFYYFSPSIFKMAFFLPGQNRVFITNAFNDTGSFNYDAHLYANGSAAISATRITSPPVVNWTAFEAFAVSLLLTLAIELIVAFIYLRAKKVKKLKRILLFIVIANLISLPILWFVFIFLLGGLGLILGEVFAVVFEGGFIYYFNRKSIKLRSAMLMSLLMNITSAVIGWLVLFLLST